MRRPAGIAATFLAQEVHADGKRLGWLTCYADEGTSIRIAFDPAPENIDQGGFDLIIGRQEDDQCR